MVLNYTGADLNQPFFIYGGIWQIIQIDIIFTKGLFLFLYRLFMKKISILTGIILSCVLAHSQVSYDIHGGPILANMSERYDSEDNFNGKFRFSERIGVGARLPISSEISFRPELNFVSKGVRIDESYSLSMGGSTYSVSAKGSLKLSYLELPLNFVYTQPSQKGAAFFIGAGPSVSLGLSGKAKADVVEITDGVREETSQSASVKFDGKENANDDYQHYKAVEFGINFLTGFQLHNKVYIAANFNQGLTNINVDKADNGKTHTMYLGLTVGYFFK